MKPVYTSDAMRAKVQGKVLLQCVVRPDGSATDIQILRSLDPVFGLDQEAIKAARQWRFAPGTPAPAGLSLAAGLALARALEQLGVEGVQLKWPNDVLVHGEKLAGILVELLPVRGRPPAAVIGIGLNLRLPADAAIPDQAGVTDLAAALGGEPPSRPVLLATILGEFHRLFDTYAAAGFPALRGAWEQRNAFAELPVAVRGESATLQGTCAGVDDDGALLLRTGDGVQRVLAGDVSLRPLLDGSR
ncbi:MAG TPA: biotin--[acetyl-CoA-carboxylase] ligase [Thauera aminoaromatica]|nr:biotin--[acetyl-CoA-carboxylase] ligase [Thauera aminoaromatica]